MDVASNNILSVARLDPKPKLGLTQFKQARTSTSSASADAATESTEAEVQARVRTHGGALRRQSSGQTDRRADTRRLAMHVRSRRTRPALGSRR